MANVYDLIARYHRELRALDDNAAKALIGTYGVVYKSLKSKMDRLIRSMEWEASKLNESEFLDPSWYEKLRDIQKLQDDLLKAMARFSDQVEKMVLRTRYEAARMAQLHAERLFRAQLPTRKAIEIDFRALPDDALKSLTAAFQPNSPVRKLLDEFGPVASKKAREAIIKALAEGRNPETLGPALRDILGVPLHRALRISRTETLRAYRTASHETFKENEDLIDGWIWSSSGDQNTCAYCRSQDGKFFSLDEPLQSHPNCRCVQIPRTKSWEELDPRLKPKKGQDPIPDSRPEVNSGDFEFSKLTREQQLELLGKERLAAYDAGDVVLLEDFFQETQDPVWGKQVRKPSLEKLLGTDLAGRYKDGFERNESLPDVLARVERNIRDRAREVSTIFDSDGKILFRRSGTDTAVSFTKEELADLKGKVLTHNHPYSGIGEDGGTFSPSDIVLAAKYGLDEIRIVTRDSIGRTILYTMQADSWPSLKKLESVIRMGVNTYSEHDGVGPMSEFEQKRTYLEVWKELSKLLRLKYTRREI